ncbi:hypothetical protein PWR63_19360 [Paraburkholderia sp. A2WS-5]|uniref:hypothetical protein n=1 Tax=unclassified Paraburkholderia TaxID=2615204 RepID=UPI003B7FCF36
MNNGLVAHNFRLSAESFKSFVFVRELLGDFRLAQFAILRESGRTRFDAFIEAFGYGFQDGPALTGGGFTGISGNREFIEAAAEAIEVNGLFQLRYGERAKAWAFAPLSEANRDWIKSGVYAESSLRAWNLIDDLIATDKASQPEGALQAAVSVTVGPVDIAKTVREELAAAFRSGDGL